MRKVPVTPLDLAYMRRAACLAKLGGGAASPNPQVGCTITRQGALVADGSHMQAGYAHAERAALAHARERNIPTKGATAYVTLEPCNHTGKTPPCTQALIEADVSRVVVGSADPNPLVSGAGVHALREAGIEVVELYDKNLREQLATENASMHKNDHVATVQELEDTLAQIQALNRGFFSRMTRNRPYVTAKYAMTLDGKIATKTGKSKWITGSAARRQVHIERARTDAIITSVGTVLADNPQMNVRLDDFSRKLFLSQNELEILEDTTLDIFRLEEPKQPLRVVCDTHLRTPLDAAIAPAIIATCENKPAEIKQFTQAGFEVWVCNHDSNGHVDLNQVLAKLAEQGVNNVTLEGGATFLGSAFDTGIVDAVQAYIAPKIFGGAQAPSPFGGSGIAQPSDSLSFQDMQIQVLDADILITANL